MKIEALKVGSDNEEDGDEDEHEINEDGEKVPKKEGGPWNKGKVEGEHIKAFVCKVLSIAGHLNLDV